VIILSELTAMVRCNISHIYSNFALQLMKSQGWGNWIKHYYHTGARYSTS